MESGLSLDVVGGPELLPAVVRLAGELSELRIVIDHLAGLRIEGREPPEQWRHEMEAAACCRAIFCKVSGLVEGTAVRGGKAPTDPLFYRPVLDFLTRSFGDQRLVYGSNWPVCEHFASLGTVHRLVADYFATQGPSSLARVLFENSRVAYRWRPAVV
jgi:L-fuconolactonase